MYVCMVLILKYAKIHTMYICTCTYGQVVKWSSVYFLHLTILRTLYTQVLNKDKLIAK